MRAIAAHAAASETRKDRNVRRTPLRRRTCFYLALMFVPAWAGTTLAVGQEPAAAAAAEKTSLARYVPDSIRLGYFEFLGIDANPDAWSKSSASKLLNDTTLGEMLDSIAVQVIEQLAPKNASARVTNAEVVQISRFLLHHGFCVAFDQLEGTATAPPAPLFVVVLKDAAKKEARPLFSRAILSHPGSSGAKLTKIGSRQVVAMPGDPNKPQDVLNWWVEGDDVVICPSTATTIVMSAIEGKGPNATSNPIRNRLLQGEGAAVLGCAFLDWAEFAARPQSQEQLKRQAEQLKGNPILNFTGFEATWKIRDEALENTVRIGWKRGAFDGFATAPKFGDEAAMPVPKGAPNYTAASLDFVATTDALLDFLEFSAKQAKAKEGATAATADPRAGYTTFVESLNKRYKVDFRKDFLGQLGPLAVGFSAPTGVLRSAVATKKQAAKAKEKEKEKDDEAAPDAAATAGSPLGMLGSMLPGGAGGSPMKGDTGLVIEIRDAKAFNRGLDAVVALLNTSIREHKRSMAAAKDKEDRGSGEGGFPGGAGRGAAGRGGARPGQTAPGGNPAPEGEAKKPPNILDMLSELKPLPGKEKSFVFTITNPKVPGSTRMFMRVGSKYLVISNSGEISQELASRTEMTNTNSAQAVAALKGLGRQASLLDFSDQGEVAADMFAKLPAVIQKTYNQAKLLMSPGAAKRTEVAAGVPSGVFQPGAVGGGFPGGAGAGGGAPGAAGPGGEPGVLVVEFEADKLPKADAMRPLLFPSTTVVTGNAEGVTMITREPFPFMSMFSPTKLGATAVTAALSLPAVQAARNAARAAEAKNASLLRAPGTAGVPGAPAAVEPPVGPRGRRGAAATDPNAGAAPPAAKGAAAGAVPGDQ